MKSQKHNEGELKELNVKIEKKVVEAVELMSKNANISIAEITVIALKRFCASHTDYLKQAPKME